MIEHKTNWLLKYAGRILVLDNGKFAVDGKPAEVFRKSETLERIGIEVPKAFRVEKLLKRKGKKIPLQELIEV